MSAKILRRISVLLVIGMTVLFIPRLFAPMPESGVAGLQSGDRCESGSSGKHGRETFISPQGLGISVVTPSDYNNRHRYGLLMMFPPAGFSGKAAERFYEITEESTAAGYVVAFSDSIPLSANAIRLQANVITEVIKRWCIDANRIVLAGHSDGGLMAQAVTLRRTAKDPNPVSVLASAAGIREEDLVSEACPEPRSVTILHTEFDERFPGYGSGVARWWARCFGCQQMSEHAGLYQCVDAAGCRERGAVHYCATKEPHNQQPKQFRSELFQILKRQKNTHSTFQDEK